MWTHGLRVRINWHDFPVSASAFVPGVETRLLRNDIQKEADALGVVVLLEEVAEFGYMGVRVWRIG